MHRAILLVVAVLVLAAPNALARGGAGAQPGQALSAQELERAVEREMKAQDRRIRSAKAQNRGLDGEIQRSKQRMLDDNDGLAHFLYGRVLATEAKDAKDAAKLQASLPALQQAVQLQPGFHHAQYRIGLVYLFLAAHAQQGLENARTKAEVERIQATVANFRALAEPPLREAMRLAPRNETYIITYASEILVHKNDPEGVKRLSEQVLRLNADNDAARELLARAYMSLKEYAKAKRVVGGLVRKNPQAIPLRVWWVECCLLLEEWDQAINELKTLLAAVPKDPRLRQTLLRAYMGKGDLPAARALLEQRLAQSPDDWATGMALMDILLQLRAWPEARERAEKTLATMPKPENAAEQQAHDAARATILGMLVFTLEQTARPLVRAQDDEQAQQRAKALFLEILRRVEEADRLVGDRLPLKLLDSGQITLAILGRHKERIPYLRRMIDHPDLAGNDEMRKQLEQVIADIEAGRAGGASQQTNPLVELMQRCTAEDPQVRRKALHEYFELDLPFVDPTIYRRHDHRVEPDAECRLWVVKILSRFENGTADPEIVRIAARYVGLALEDPSSSVRRAAAQGLGKIGAPAGVIYMLPHLAAMPLDTAPATDAAAEELEREYNATRMALTKLTGHVDYQIGDEAWVTLKDAPANREAWKAWLDTTDGVAKRREGMADLAEVKDVDPRWQLRYILADVIAVEPPAPTPIALDAYKVLRDRIRDLPAEKREGDPWWRAFPLYPDAEVSEATLPRIRSELKGWWSTVRRGGK